MFKEGQLVTAKEYNLYAVTDRGKPLEVVNCNHNRMRVKCLWTNDEEYTVEIANFRPMSYDEILKPGQKVIIDAFQDAKGKSSTEIATFLGYRTYGAGVRFNSGNSIAVSMHSVKGVVKGGLYI
jgi:hypothetical protein